MYYSPGAYTGILFIYVFNDVVFKVFLYDQMAALTIISGGIVGGYLNKYYHTAVQLKH